MNAFAIQATVMNRCSVLLFSILPSGQETRTIVNLLLLKVEMECSGSFPDKMIEEAGCSIFWTGRAEWIQVFKFF